MFFLIAKQVGEEHDMPKICRIKGCNREDIAGYGLCSKHYRRWRRHGDPNKIFRKESTEKDTLVKRYHYEYKSYCSMMTRCYNKQYPQYKDYGGRGITVCLRWMGSCGFMHFLKDLGPREKGMTLDRINVNGNYEPDNCRWATRKEQSANRRKTIRWDYNGVVKTLSEWSALVGIPATTLYVRWHQYKWTIEETLTRPYHPKPRSKKNISAD